MKAKYTPGPWKAMNHPTCDCISIGEPHDVYSSGFATVYLNTAANAALIAAAPDLLEALDFLLEQTIDFSIDNGFELTEGEIEARAMALAAIAKAKGE